MYSSELNTYLKTIIIKKKRLFIIQNFGEHVRINIAFFSTTMSKIRIGRSYLPNLLSSCSYRKIMDY